MTQVIGYRDAETGGSGWLVFDGLDCRIAAGGCRVQRGLTAGKLAMLAGRMTLKERLLGINVDGAKCGLDLDPRDPGKAAAVRRFLRFLRPHLATRFSMGCDMGTRWAELEGLARAEGIWSIKHAVKTGQGLSDDEFFARLRTLEAPLGMMTVGQRRAGHALAQAALAAAGLAGIPAPRCALQGFGNLGRAAAYSLAEEGVRITAVADEYGCVTDPAGLDVTRMLATRHGTPVPLTVPGAHRRPGAEVFDAPADVLLLAAGERAVSAERAARLRFPVVVVGANYGLSPEVERSLVGAGTLVVPDFVGGVGGSASMEALFGPARPPAPADVLDGLTAMMHQIMAHLAGVARQGGLSLRGAAEKVAAEAPVSPGDRPYGGSPYLAEISLARAVGGVR